VVAAKVNPSQLVFFWRNVKMNMLLPSSVRVSDLTLIKMKAENPASSLFFLPGKSECWHLHFQGSPNVDISPGVFRNLVPLFG